TGYDYYAVSLAVGETVTVATTGLSAGNLTLELLAANDTVLTTGVAGATNLSQVISNYVVPATGTYYVRLSGDAGTAYSVVVTRNSGFDTESNDSISTPQNLAGNKSALGFLGTSGAAYDFTAGAQGFAINNAI